ncbi:MAG: thioredoxin-dependent thiol peroxidase [Candidatus Competibacteraceae bacterium]|nr:thioredoxin-dependent thiol peroxidase [Candidatus Competibacteraceae bacterium]
MQHKLTIGMSAPKFSAPDQEGNTISLSMFKGKKVILYFYPKDNTPGCTNEACAFRDGYEELLTKGYVVIGVSTDHEASHQRFISRHQLPFSLIADTEKKVHELYGTWQEKKMYGKSYMGTLRHTFVIDELGNIEKIITKVDTKNPIAQVLV